MQKSPRMIGVLAGLLAVALAWWVLPAWASNEDVRFLFHLVEAPDTGDACALAPADVPCTQAVVNGNLETPYFAYLMVAHGDTTAGISGISFGLQYDPGVEIQDWILCASGLEFPLSGYNGPWPATCSGTILTWLLPSDCRKNTVPAYESQGVLTIAGVFRLVAHSSGQLRIAYPPLIQGVRNLSVTDCANKVMLFDQSSGVVMGMADFDGYAAGVNPCLPVVHYSTYVCPDHAPVAPITWGRIKSLYH